MMKKIKLFGLLNVETSRDVALLIVSALIVILSINNIFTFLKVIDVWWKWVLMAIYFLGLYNLLRFVTK